MKAKLIIVVVFICSWTLSLAQKRATYFISPISVTYKVLSQNEKQNVSVENVYSPQQVKNCIDEITDLQVKTDMYYIAYLIKTELLYSNYKKEIETKYNLNCITQLVQSLSEKELYNFSKGHSKEVKKYRK